MSTIKVRIRQDDGTEINVLFGDSYKKWQTQFQEFMYRRFNPPGEGWRYTDELGSRIVVAWKTRKAWISFGGLKWCTETISQEELDHEGKGRQASDFDFNPMNMNELLAALREY